MPLTTSRREAFGLIACAFATAGLPCRIPTQAAVQTVKYADIVYGRVDVNRAIAVYLNNVVYGKMGA